MKSTDRDPNWSTFLIVGDAVQWIAVGLLLEVLLFEGTTIGMSLRWLTVAVLLWAVSRSHAWLLLLAVQLSLLFREQSRPQVDYGLGSIVYCLVAVGLVTYVCGFATLRNELKLEIAKKLQWIAEQNPQSNRRVKILPQAGPHSIAWLMRVVLSIFVVLISIFAIMHLPISASGRELLWYRSIRNNMTLWPGPAIVVGATAGVVFFWQNNWTLMTPQQARLYLRSVFMYCHYGDLSMIVTRAFASIRKARLANERTSKADNSPRVEPRVGPYIGLRKKSSVK